MNETAGVRGRGSGVSAKAADVNPTVLRAEGLDRFFIDGDQRLDVLRGVSLALRGGEVTALVGRSGSGKSTLLHLLGMLDRPNAGEIILDNTVVSALNETDRSYMRNQHIGFVFQHYFLLPEFTVLENVLIPAKVACSVWSWPKKKSEFTQRAEKIIDQVGLSSHVRAFPKTLSGGERQRVTLARALLLQPKILLCDEPTGNLDTDTGSAIMDLIFNMSQQQGAAALVATHDLSLSARAAHILRLDHGRLTVEK